jgi:hypothetical protein
MSFKMVDMLETPKQEQTGYAAPAMPMVDNKPRYPYGLCICLNEESMEKLGIDELPEVGTMIHGMFMAKVTSVRANATEENTSKGMDLQITHLALEDEDAEYSYKEKLYDRGNEEEEDE